MKQQSQQKKEYRIKNNDGQAAANETETPKRPQTTRNRRNNAAAKDGTEVEEYKGGTGGRARSNRRRQN